MTRRLLSIYGDFLILEHFPGLRNWFMYCLVFLFETID